MQEGREDSSRIDKSNPQNIQCPIKILDFRIVRGKRIYEIVWLEDGTFRSKWEELQQLQDHPEALSQFISQNGEKIRAIQNEWNQYVSEGRVRNLETAISLNTVDQQKKDRIEPEQSDYSLESAFQNAKEGENLQLREMRFAITPTIVPRKMKKKKTKKIKRVPRTGIIPKVTRALNKSNVSEEQMAGQDNQVSDRQEQNSNKTSLSAVEQSSSFSVIVGPEKKNIRQPQPIKISKKREEILQLCHKAIERVKLCAIETQREVKDDPGKLDEDLASKNNGGKSEAIPVESKSVEEHKQQSQEMSIQNVSSGIFTPEQSFQSNIERVQIAASSLSLQELRRSNVREFLLENIYSLKIDPPKKLPTPQKCRKSQTLSFDHGYQQLKDTKLPVLEKPTKKPYQIATLLKCLEVNNINQIDRKGSSLYDNQRYIAANLLSYESTLHSSPKIFKINGHFRYKALILYSISIGNAYQNQQRFCLVQTLERICPKLLQDYHFHIQ